MNNSVRTIARTHGGVIDSLVSHPKAGVRQIAPGFSPAPWLDLKNLGGKIIPDLSFKNVYLDAFPAADKASIDRALANAMSDEGLNNVIKQYFNDAPITTTFLGSSSFASANGATFNRDDVGTTLDALVADGTLSNVDFGTTVICLFLPPGRVLSTDGAGTVKKSASRSKKTKLLAGDDADSSLQGLGGYHGSHKSGSTTIYFAVGAYSQMAGGQANGIPFWPDPWKNMVATFYHELNEARTDADVEEAIRSNSNKYLGWYANVDGGGEIGDIPMSEAGSSLSLVMTEVSLVNGGSAPIQLMWSNAVHGPEGPFI